MSFFETGGMKVLETVGYILLAIGGVLGTIWVGMSIVTNRNQSTAISTTTDVGPIKSAWTTIQHFASQNGLNDWTRDSIKKLIADSEMPTGSAPSPNPSPERPVEK